MKQTEGGCFKHQYYGAMIKQSCCPIVFSNDMVEQQRVFFRALLVLFKGKDHCNIKTDLHN
ncbi:MAG: hypothetical protein ACRC31_03455, partial [Cetobacterium sp.]